MCDKITAWHSGTFHGAIQTGVLRLHWASRAIQHGLTDKAVLLSAKPRSSLTQFHLCAFLILYKHMESWFNLVMCIIHEVHRLQRGFASIIHYIHVMSEDIHHILLVLACSLCPWG